MATPQKFTVKRAARKGRPISPETVAAHATLTKMHKVKGNRSEIEVTDEAGKVLETYSALVVDAPTLGKPKGYTGMVGLIGAWAKANGLAVKVSQVSDTHYAIRDKG